MSITYTDLSERSQEALPTKSYSLTEILRRINMAQSAGQMNRSHSSEGEADSEKESPVYQTDFSVTKRLLTPYHNSGSNSSLTATPILSYRPGHLSSQSQGATLPAWQALLPTDQGPIPSRSYQPRGWKHSVQNVTLVSERARASTTYQSLGYGGPGHSSYLSQSPDSSTAIKKSHQPDDDEDSSEETDENSSSHSHSSNGDPDGIDEPRKPKRTRTAYSNHQLDQLELAFSRSHYPDVFTREDLSTKLSIKEDRIQVWFQNRRARYRKQERTGSISLRSKYRQKRLHKLQQGQVAAAAAMGSGMYPAYYPSSGNSSSGGMVTSPQSTVSPYMSGFTFPPTYMPTSIGSIAVSGGGIPISSSVIVDGMSSVQSTVASPGYLPGFNTLKSSIPFPSGYVTMGLPNTGSTYSPASSNHLIIPVSHK